MAIGIGISVRCAWSVAKNELLLILLLVVFSLVRPNSHTERNVVSATCSASGYRKENDNEITLSVLDDKRQTDTQRIEMTGLTDSVLNLCQLRCRRESLFSLTNLT